MTAPSTDELTRLLAECTPGPWIYEYTRLGHTVRQPGSHLSLMVVNHAENLESDARLIAAAPTIAADLIALRKAAEGMAEALENYEEAIRQHIATEFPNSAWVPANLKEAIEQGRADIAAYEELKP